MAVLQELRRILDTMESEVVHYQIGRTSTGGLIVYATLVGARLVIEAKVDNLTYRLFKGSEDVHVDLRELEALVELRGAMP